MVGQAAKAADMRAGNVPKPGMKSMNGGGGSMSVSTQKYKPPEVEKAKPKPKAVSHSQMAMEWEANGRDKNGKLIKHVDKPKGWTKDDVNRARDRALEEQRRAAAGPVMTDAADAGEEVESAPDGEPAHVLARARMGELALALQGLAVDEDEFLLVTPPDAVAAFRERCDALGEDAASAEAAALRAVAAHPPLEFALQLTAHGERAPQVAEATAEQGDSAAAAPIALVAAILLRVRFPPEYPQAPPAVTVEDAMVTTQAPHPPKKVLTTLALLDEGAVVGGFLERAAETLPDPCIYEAATWLTASAFEFVGQAWL